PSLALAQQTVAEKTDYNATSRHADVVAFCEELGKKSAIVRQTSIGKSGEGRDLPMLILADPPIRTPEEAVRSKKLVVLAFANIHAGEVDGKEAALMLSRDIATGDDKVLLKELVIRTPLTGNGDGKKKTKKPNRTPKRRPPGGVGFRANGGGSALTRDFVKREPPEARPLTKTTPRWAPAVIVDLHTTNGSFH